VKRFRNEIGVGCLLIAALAALLYMSFKVGALKSLGDTVTVEALFDDAAGLVEDGDVRMYGVRIGGVGSLDIEDGRCRATLVLRRDAGVRKDVKAEVRARSVLGEKYVALIPRGEQAPALENGDRIVDTAIPYEIDQMVTAMGPLLEQVDPDDVAAIVSAVADLSRGGELDAGSLIAEAEKLLVNLNEMAEVGPQVRQDVPVILRNLRTTSERLPGTLERLDRTLDRADALVADVDEAAADLPQTMDDVRATAAELRELSEALGDSSEDIGPMVEDLATILETLSAFDEATIRSILQEEGVRVRMCPKKPQQ
jgi:phospholipid/cholesterol/gamma-HCH transport system substrate-binding protein